MRADQYRSDTLLPTDLDLVVGWDVTRGRVVAFTQAELAGYTTTFQLQHPPQWRDVNTPQLIGGVYTVVEADMLNGLNCQVACTVQVPLNLATPNWFMVRKAVTGDVTIAIATGGILDLPGGLSKITTSFKTAIVFPVPGANRWSVEGLEA